MVIAILILSIFAATGNGLICTDCVYAKGHFGEEDCLTSPETAAVTTCSESQYRSVRSPRLSVSKAYYIIPSTISISSASVFPQIKMKAMCATSEGIIEHLGQNISVIVRGCGVGPVEHDKSCGVKGYGWNTIDEDGAIIQINGLDACLCSDKDVCNGKGSAGISEISAGLLAFGIGFARMFKWLMD